MAIEYNFIESTQFSTIFKEYSQEIFDDNFDFDIVAVLSEAEKDQIQNNRQAFKEIEKYYLVAKKEGKIIGWSVGHQINSGDFFMGNSAVLPGFRRLGVYTKMLDLVVKRLKNNGYQMIISLHKLDNNAVLIPKLKYGFIITGFDVNDKYGILVKLAYLTNPKRKELLEVRIGSRKMNEDYLKLMT